MVKFPINTSKFRRIFLLFERKYGKFIGQKLANLWEKIFGNQQAVKLKTTSNLWISGINNSPTWSKYAKECGASTKA